MRFSTAPVLAFAASFFALASALAAPEDSVVDSKYNPITAPLGDVKVKAGTAYTVTWNPTAGDSVTITLRKGEDSKALDTLEILAKNLPNTGAFIWTPSTQLKGSDDYAIQISSDNPDTTNYSPKFKIDSNGPGITSTIEPTTTLAIAASLSKTYSPVGIATESAYLKAASDATATASGASATNTSDDESDARRLSSGGAFLVFAGASLFFLS